MPHTDASLANRLFPLGIASGAGFCDRDSEREELKANMLSGTHTYIVGSRRLGKTSLVLKACEELGRKRAPRVHSQELDLLTIHSADALDAAFRRAIGELSGSFLPRNRRALGKLAEFFAAFRPELTVRDDGISLRLYPVQPTPDAIVDLLLALDQAASHYRRRAVLVIDEFQQITLFDEGHGIEGAIRHVAQRAQSLSFVFLGSERTLLTEMFESRDRPLYNSGSRRLALGRIPAEEYRQFLDDAARLRWRRGLNDEAAATILRITDRHPAFVNLLCNDLWRERRPPSVAAVNAAWQQILDRERHQVFRALMALSYNQRAILQALAAEPTRTPTSRDYLARYGFAGSTMAQALDVLRNKDFIRQSPEGRFEVIDPLVRDVLASGLPED